MHVAHLDCDAFYASVEKRDRPELAQVPVIVGGGRRGVVTTACYLARTFGVRSAMPMFKAMKACPQAIVIAPDFRKYKLESDRILDHLRRLTPLVQPLSLDEAWLDLAGTDRLNGGAPALVLARVQAEIEHETGLTVSIGLAANRFLAKIASELDKPRGFAVIGAAEARDFLAPRPVSILPGVGAVSARDLHRGGFKTVGDLARADPRDLAERFGNHGLRLAELAQGKDGRAVTPESMRKSISAETTFHTDLCALAGLEPRLWACCEKVAASARHAGFSGGAVVLKLKTSTFRLITRRRRAASPIQSARSLFSLACEMLASEVDGTAYRLIGVGLTDLTRAENSGAELFDNRELRARRTEAAIDRLRARFGEDAVVSGRSFADQ